jgi:hypothetical protein
MTGVQGYALGTLRAMDALLGDASWTVIAPIGRYLLILA